MKKFLVVLLVVALALSLTTFVSAAVGDTMLGDNIVNVMQARGYEPSAQDWVDGYNATQEILALLDVRGEIFPFIQSESGEWMVSGDVSDSQLLCLMRNWLQMPGRISIRCAATSVAPVEVQEGSTPTCSPDDSYRYMHNDYDVYGPPYGWIYLDMELSYMADQLLYRYQYHWTRDNEDQWYDVWDLNTSASWYGDSRQLSDTITISAYCEDGTGPVEVISLNADPAGELP